MIRFLCIFSLLLCLACHNDIIEIRRYWLSDDIDIMIKISENDKYDLDYVFKPNNRINILSFIDCHLENNSRIMCTDSTYGNLYQFDFLTDDLMIFLAQKPTGEIDEIGVCYKYDYKRVINLNYASTSLRDFCSDREYVDIQIEGAQKGMVVYVFFDQKLDSQELIDNNLVVRTMEPLDLVKYVCNKYRVLSGDVVLTTHLTGQMINNTTQPIGQVENWGFNKAYYRNIINTTGYTGDIMILKILDI